MGSIPNGSAPLQACARQIFKSMLPGRTGKAQVRLAAAGRLRSAVALELAAGKVWALPIAVQIQLVGSSGATARATLNGLGATACAPVAASHHACGREELLRCWADSETRLQGVWRSEYPLLARDGEAGPRAGLSRPGQPRRQTDGSRSTVSAVP
jgi:hypothetical protein